MIMLPPEGSEPLGKPIPERKKGESKKDYASDVIGMMHHEGKPHKQSIAIGLRQAGLSKKSIPLWIPFAKEPCCAHAVIS
jgi:hypothetical protein